MKRHGMPGKLKMLNRCLLVGSVLLPAAAQAEQTLLIEQDTRLGVWLADWLNVQHTKSDSAQSGLRPREPYLPGLIWKNPSEEANQRKLQHELLMALEALPCESDAPCAETQRAQAKDLAEFVASLPITGRVRLEKSDPRWLEVNPKFDPLIRAGHQIVLPDRPSVVAVVRANGALCRVQHDPALFALDYLVRCDSAAKPQTAWVVQPDGLVKRFGVAAWNRQAQEPPAPGAWIVADDARELLPESIFTLLARMLATQGPVADQNKSAAVAEAATILEIAPKQINAARKPRDLPVSASDWGSVGLLQTPTARMAEAGEGSIGYNRTKPYSRLNVTLQPFDWFETSFRYIDVSNRLYGPAIAGDQSYKDKNIDFKLRLTTESEFMPQIAVGVRDVGGTGLFAGEYIVANKRSGNFDWSLGIGWGYVGARGDLSNPLGFLGSDFDKRPFGSSGPSGGEFNFEALFHGPAAIFGGVQFQTPWDSLLLKLEYEGNDYQREPQNNNQRQTSPINLGVVYRVSPNLDLNLGWERGTTANLGLSFHGRLDRLTTPKLNDPTPLAVQPGPPAQVAGDWLKTAAELEYRTRWRVRQIRPDGAELIVGFENVSAKYWHQHLDRIASVLHRDAPTEVQLFRVQDVGNGLKTNEYLIDRYTWADAKTRYLPLSERQPSVFERQQTSGLAEPYEEVWFDKPAKTLDTQVGVTYAQTLGGPDGFLLYQLGVGAKGDLRLRQDTWLSGSVRARLLDNYDRFKYDPPEKPLPRVRTHLREYLTTSEVTLPQLQLTHVGQAGRDHYYSLYGGMLESMYGGIGGEWLYRPWGSSVALGADLNWVRQRGFEQDFSFRNYDTSTGHLSLYWNTGVEGIVATLSAGKYLAGDLGGTLDLSRSFRNGVRIGAWATKTDVSAEEFGEGSFDKGIYVSIPFDAMMTRSGGSTANLIWQPLTRDGGARLNRAYKLYDLTGTRSGETLKWKPFGDAGSDRFVEGDSAGTAGVTPLLERPLWSIVGEDISLLGRATMRPDFWNYALIATGVTLASASLDKSADKLAVNHGDRKIMQGIEKFGDWLPVVSMGLSGMAALGTRDAWLSKASLASLEAGAAGLLISTGGKYVFGRSRPEEDLGRNDFEFFSRGNKDKSFPSNHTTVAWAALTPYAKAYKAPWLYGLAATTNLARISGRKHWLSDTVGSAFLGYALGSLFWEARDHGSKSSPRLYIGPEEIGLEWRTP